tara:strand:- start:118 stop:354 length:237 start_codon:yes stop_codon:yes gene_type:complete
MITINITKAKEYVHDKRRTARSAEFAPLDEVIMKQIPGTDAAAVEAERQVIRDKYAAIQSDINSATDAAALKTIIEGL